MVTVVLGNQKMEFDTSTVEGTAALNDAMNAWQDEQIKYIQQIAEELNISDYWAMQIAYLRTRSRHTQELENQLIDMARNGATGLR
jgi:hypothetical protein